MVKKQVDMDQDQTITWEIVLDMYEDLLQTIWDKSSRTLGVIAMEALIHQAITENSASYAWFKQLKVSQMQGVQFANLREHLKEKPIEHHTLKAGFRALVLSLLSTVVDLPKTVASEPFSDTLDDYLSDVQP